MTKKVEIEVQVRAQTKAAILIYDGKTECWIPKSQITDFTGEGDESDMSTTVIFIGEGLAKDIGLI